MQGRKCRGATGPSCWMLPPSPRGPQGLPGPRRPPEQGKRGEAGDAGSQWEPARGSRTAALASPARRTPPRPTQVAAYGHKSESQEQPGLRGIFPWSSPAKKLKLKHIPPPLCQENKERSQRQEQLKQGWLQTPKSRTGGGQDWPSPSPPAPCLLFPANILKSVIWLQFPEDCGERGRGKGRRQRRRHKRQSGKGDAESLYRRTTVGTVGIPRLMGGVGGETQAEALTGESHARRRPGCERRSSWAAPHRTLLQGRPPPQHLPRNRRSLLPPSCDTPRASQPTAVGAVCCSRVAAIQPSTRGSWGPCLHLDIVPITPCPRPSPSRVNRPGAPLWRNVMSGLD